MVQGRGIQDLGIVPHPIVLSFVEALKENNAVERYVEHMAKQLYSGNEHSAVAGAYKNGLAYFIHGILSFSEGLNIMRRQYENAPDAPYSPEMLPFLKNEKICAPYQEGIDGLLVKLGFTYPAVRPAPNS